MSVSYQMLSCVNIIIKVCLQLHTYDDVACMVIYTNMVSIKHGVLTNKKWFVSAE